MHVHTPQAWGWWLWHWVYGWLTASFGFTGLPKCICDGRLNRGKTWKANIGQQYRRMGVSWGLGTYRIYPTCPWLLWRFPKLDPFWQFITWFELSIYRHVSYTLLEVLKNIKKSDGQRIKHDQTQSVSSGADLSASSGRLVDPHHRNSASPSCPKKLQTNIPGQWAIRRHSP